MLPTTYVLTVFLFKHPISVMFALIKNLYTDFISLLKVIVFVVRPFKSLAVYEHYLALSARTSNSNLNPDHRKLVRQFRLLYAVITCQAVVQLFHYISAPYFKRTPETTNSLYHLLTFDLIHYYRLPRVSYIVLSLQCPLVIYYLHLYYFRPNAYFSFRLKTALFGNKKKKWLHLIKKDDQEILLQVGLGKWFQSRPESVEEILRRVAVVITNFFEGFILIFDLAILVNVTVCARWFYRTAFNYHHFSSSGWEVVFVHLPLFLSHGFVYHAHGFAYLYVIGFTAALAFVTLVFWSLLVRENNIQIRRALKLWDGKKLCAALQENIAIFRLLFAVDSLLGNAFFVFILLNFPTAALLSMMVFFGGSSGRWQWSRNIFLLFILFILVVEMVIGVVLLHISLAKLSQRLHSGAPLLVKWFSGVDEVGGGVLSKKVRNNEKQKISLRYHVTVWTHTMRLLTANRYSFTYGIVGSPVTMRTFIKCLLLWAKMLMYSYNLITRH